MQIHYWDFTSKLFKEVPRLFRNLVAFLLPALRRVLCSGSRKTSGPNSCESGYVLLLVFVLILAPASVFAQDNEPTQESRAVQEKKEDPPAPKSENEKAESKATVDPSAMADASAKKNSNSSTVSYTHLTLPTKA